MKSFIEVLRLINIKFANSSEEKIRTKGEKVGRKIVPAKEQKRGKIFDLCASIF